MTASMSATAPSARLPAWFWPVAALALIWNGYGVYQFAQTALADEQRLIAAGMSASQAALYAGLPAWMPLAFALGVFGGVLGSVLLLARRRLATPVLAASLLGYLVLWAGDAALGVFAAFGIGQAAILTLVVAIAAGLLVLARRFERAGPLG